MRDSELRANEDLQRGAETEWAAFEDLPPVVDRERDGEALRAIGWLMVAVTVGLVAAFAKGCA
jgi:hypothetical protein